MRCKRCGTELKNDDEFCYRCGQRTSIFQRMFANKTFVGSLAAILIVIVAAVIFFLIWTEKLKFPDRISGSKEVQEQADGSDSQKLPEQKKEISEPGKEPEQTPEAFTPRDATADMKSELKAITRRLRPFLAFSARYYENNAASFQWDDGFAATLALYNLYNVEKTVKYGDAYSDIKKKVKAEMKALFGSCAKYNLTYGGSYPDYVYRRVNDTVIYNVSRITGKTYHMSVDRIIEYEKNRYRAVVSACLVSQYRKEDKGYEQKYTLFFEKAEDSKYGYYVSRMKQYRKKDLKVK